MHALGISDDWLCPSGREICPQSFLSPSLLARSPSWLSLTHTGRRRDIPLGQCPRYRETLDFWGPLKGVARVAFEADDGPHGEVTAQPFAIAGFWHRTALCGTGSGHRCGNKGT